MERFAAVVGYAGAARLNVLRTAHAAAAVVAEVAVAVADGDGAAVVAGRGVRLEVGELFAAGGGRAAVLEHHAGAGEELEVDLAAVAVAVRVTVGVAVRVTIGVTVRVAVGFRRSEGGGFAFGLVGGGLGFGRSKHASATGGRGFVACA